MAATAMFFAVASSAFILRARMARSCCPAKAAVAPIVIEVEPRDYPTIEASDDCGAAVVKPHADGSETWSFEPCPELPAVIGAQPAPAERSQGVLVHDVHLPAK